MKRRKRKKKIQYIKRNDSSSSSSAESDRSRTPIRINKTRSKAIFDDGALQNALAAVEQFKILNKMNIPATLPPQASNHKNDALLNLLKPKVGNGATGFVPSTLNTQKESHANEHETPSFVLGVEIKSKDPSNANSETDDNDI